MGNDKIERVGEIFSKELEDIKETRKKMGIDKKRIGVSKLTNLIPFHSSWIDIKEDLIKFQFDKKGLSTMGLFAFILLSIFFILIIGIYLFMFVQIDSVFNQDLEIGQVNLQDVNSVTFGSFTSAFLQTADYMGIFILVGECLILIATGYFFRGKYPRLMIVIDIFILIFILILSVYVSNTYETLINATPTLDVFINDLPKSSTFLLSLPYIVSILGAIIIIVSYAFPMNETEERINGM